MSPDPSFSKTFLAGLFVWGIILSGAVFLGFIYGTIGSVLSSNSLSSNLCLIALIALYVFACLHMIGWIAKRLACNQRVSFLGANYLMVGWQIVWRGFLVYFAGGFILSIVYNVLNGTGSNSDIPNFVFAITGIVLGIYALGWSVEHISVKLRLDNRVRRQNYGTTQSGRSVGNTSGSEIIAPELLHDCSEAQGDSMEDTLAQRNTSRNVKHVWLIPAIACLLLLAAWQLRWDKGPTQTFNNGELKIVHMHDRWSGQAWVAIYGVDDGKFYSGEMEPVVSEADMAIRKKQILARPKEAKKMAELKQKLSLPALYGGGEEAEWKIQDQEELAATKAKSELKSLARRQRTIATRVWTGLVALSVLLTGFLFWRQQLHSK
jgi:hypothetical protein